LPEGRGHLLRRLSFSLRQRFYRWQARPAVQRRALGFYPTRRLARRRARALFDLCAGFTYSQVLAFCEQLDLFERLADAPLALDPLAASSRVPAERLEPLLQAAVTLGLLASDGDRYGLGPLGAARLGNPGVAAMVRHHDRLYEDLADPLALAADPGRSTALAQYWAYAGTGERLALSVDQVAAYSELMASSQAFIAAQVLRAMDFGRCRRLLDVGGGYGAFAMALAERWPGLQVTVFDLPAVAAGARQRIEAAGFGDRVHAQGGDLFRGELPGGFDTISLVRVLHDHDEPAVLSLLERLRAVLPSDGQLLIAEPLRGGGGSEAYFAWYFLAMGQGRLRSADEYAELLTAAGFAAPRRLATPLPLLAEVLVTGPDGDSSGNSTGKSVNPG